MSSDLDGLARWINRIDAAARSTLSTLPDGADARAFSSDFIDERAHRRDIDSWILAALFGLDAPDQRDAARDVRCWRALLHRDVPAMTELAASAPDEFGRRADSASIESWTDTELSSLHAAGALALSADEPELRSLCARWSRAFVDEIQPDNATNQAWAIHAFVDLAVGGDVEADMYAQTLLHNCMFERGRPDVRSALLLHHGAMCLGRSSDA